MALSVYVHIPYCLQRCRYCDFTTFEIGSIIDPSDYLNLLRAEITNRSPLVGPQRLESIYFGGGTPSLLSADALLSILEALRSSGFTWSPRSEVTVEVNPATLTREKLESLLYGGVNRFSVGAQSFSDELLQLCGRRHSAEDTRNTLRLLQENDCNYSFDLLFALPGQTIEQLGTDLEEVASFAPDHLSAYCLTVPEGHPMSRGRPLEDTQVEMFKLIEDRLKKVGLLKYEISNFAKHGYESQHNLGYWSGRQYWGIGVSAHSYFSLPPYGVRFWNPRDLSRYAEQVAQIPSKPGSWDSVLPSSQLECLAENEALSDLAHTRLRVNRGLPVNAALQEGLSWAAQELLDTRLEQLADRGLVTRSLEAWRLTPEGTLLNNLVLEQLTFTSDELDAFARRSAFRLQ